MLEDPPASGNAAIKLLCLQASASESAQKRCPPFEGTIAGGKTFILHKFRSHENNLEEALPCCWGF